MAGREKCKQFRLMDDYKVVVLWPDRAGEHLTIELLWHGGEMGGEDKSHRGKLGGPARVGHGHDER